MRPKSSANALPRLPREQPPALSVLHPHAAGIDVHSDMHMVCVPAGSVATTVAEPGGLPPQVRRFGANSCDLHAIADWLQSCGVTTVAMESTGVYWIPLFEMLIRYAAGHVLHVQKALEHRAQSMLARESLTATSSRRRSPAQRCRAGRCRIPPTDP